VQRAQRLKLIVAELVGPLVEAKVERLDLARVERHRFLLGRREIVDERIDLFL